MCKELIRCGFCTAGDTEVEVMLRSITTHAAICETCIALMFAALSTVLPPSTLPIFNETKH